MVFLTNMEPASGLIDASAARELGKDLNSAYNSADPFPHIVIDDFLPQPVIDMCLGEFGHGPQKLHAEYNRAQERKKRQYVPDTMSPALRHLFYSFNSRPFVEVLENITGIRGLIPDPWFLGGGFHEVQNGGHLSIHADFNHHKPLGLERRLNVLIYLNDYWFPDYGGQLELWDEGMTKCVKSIVPSLNRCVIFNTTSHSNHGNPNPVNHPGGRSRKSIALYYYTATWDGEAKRSHTTQFRRRPQSADKTDWKIKAMELAKDIAPPIVLRAARRLMSA